MRKQQEVDRRLQEEQDEANRLLREQLNLHYFIDPGKESPIISTDQMSYFFWPQIDFSFLQLEFSPFISRFRYDKTDCDVTPPSRSQEWTAGLQECTTKLKRRITKI